MSSILACFQLLELDVISAQDLTQTSRSMQTYAVAWVDPDRKLSTRVDTEGRNNPTWNEKFVFRVDDDFLCDDASVIVIDIYAIHWFKDVHVGTSEVLVSDLMPPSSRPFHNTQKPVGMKFVGLQVRRPSGRPKGILNVGVQLLDGSMRSMPLYTHNPSKANEYPHDDHHNKPSRDELAKQDLRRTKSDSSSMVGSELTAREEPRAKPKNGKSNSVITPTEAGLKTKKKTGSVVSGCDVKATPRRGKFGKRPNRGFKANGSEISASEINVLQKLTRKMNNNGGYEVTAPPKPMFRNSPAVGYGGGPRSARATPLHTFSKLNGAFEYATPRRSNLGHTGRPFMTDSELGPSPSEVAAIVARQPRPVDEGENSTIGGWSLDDGVEPLHPKVDRWRTELPTVYDGSETLSKKGKHARRKTDGDSGLFSCFSNICGIECSITCGGGGSGGSGGGKGKKNRRRRAQSVVDDASFM